MSSQAQKVFPDIRGLTARENTDAQDHPLIAGLHGAFHAAEAVRETQSAALHEVLATTLKNALQNQNPQDLKAIQLALDELLRLRFELPGHDAERSAVLFSIQQKIIEAIFADDTKNLTIDAPNTPEGFKKWFFDKCDQYQDSPHPLFDYIEQKAGIEGFKYLVSQEGGVHVVFADVIAAIQIGSGGLQKSEFFENFEDEIGHGDPEKFHPTMFGRLLKELGIDSIEKKDLTWQALACGNYIIFLSYFRSFYHECTGYLGFLEALTSARFAKISRGGARLGISDLAMTYHAEHSELDIEHTAGWVNSIIMRDIAENPAAAEKVARGVLVREEISRRYWDALLEGCLKADGVKS